MRRAAPLLPLTAGALLLLAGPALAHDPTAHAAPDAPDPTAVVVVLAVAGGLLLAPRLGRPSVPSGRLHLLARALLGVGAVATALTSGLDGPRLALAAGLPVLLALPEAGAAVGLLLLLLPGLLLLPDGAVPELLVGSAHLLGAGLWAGAVLHLVLARPDRAAVRAAAPVAGGAALLAVASGVASAALHGLGPDLLVGSAYGRLLLLKGVAVGAVLLLGALLSGLLPVRLPRLPVLRLEAAGLAGVVVLGAVLAAGPGVVPDLHLPRGLALAGDDAALLVARDTDGSRWLRVTGARSLSVPGATAHRALDGALVAPLLPTTTQVRVAGRTTPVPPAAALAGGPGDADERLARTVGALLSGAAAPALVETVPEPAALHRPGLPRQTVLVDGDPRGAALLAALPGARAVDVRRPVPLHADVVYVATGWAGATGATALAEAAHPLGGVVLLPWLVAPGTVDRGRGDGLLLLADRPLEDPVALAYRRSLGVLPGDRPSLAGLGGFAGTTPSAGTSTYAAAPAGILPAGIDPHTAHASSALPPWVAAGALTPVRRPARA